MKKIIVSLGLLVSTMFANNQFEININNETIELGTSFDLRGNMNLPSSSAYTLDIRYLRTEEAQRGETSHHLANIGFKVVEPVSNNYGTVLGLGMDALYSDSGSDLFLAIPFTLYGRYDATNKLFIDANIKYAPKILSFNDAKSYGEIRATINFAMTTNAIVYAGGRYIDAKFKDYEVNYDETAFAGFKFVF